MTSRTRPAGRRLLPLLLVGAVLTLSATACKPLAPQPTQSTQQVVATTAPVSELPTVSAEPTSVPATTAPLPVAKTTVRVYLVRGEFLGIGTARAVPANAPAKAAMEQLLAGPTPAEKLIGLRSEIPKGTKLLGVSIAGGVATVNLSKQFESGGGTLTMTLRIAQVVNTLTQFSGVNAVAFKIGGKVVESIGGEGLMVSPSVGRSDYESALPAIMLESPLPWATIGSPVRLRGSANVFEAVFRVRITDASGKVVAEKPVTATSGTGTRGAFDALIAFKVTKHGKGSITVFEPSAKDGTPTNVVKIPVKL
jgi:germination protein M